jgi:hypothetical protein
MVTKLVTELDGTGRDLLFREWVSDLGKSIFLLLIDIDSLDA